MKINKTCIFWGEIKAGKQPLKILFLFPAPHEYTVLLSSALSLKLAGVPRTQMTVFEEGS